MYKVCDTAGDGEAINIQKSMDLGNVMLDQGLGKLQPAAQIRPMVAFCQAPDIILEFRVFEDL